MNTCKPTVLFLGMMMLVGPLHGQDRASEVDEIFERWNAEDSPGCTVGVAEDGETVVERAYGMADLEFSEPNTPVTIFEPGSVSKQFAAAAVVLLSLDGELSLDDDVRTYVPELPAYEEPITIRHLLNHTSGLRDWGSVAALSGWGRRDRAHNHAHVVDILSRQGALNYPPGERYSYTNSGYNLLPVIVDRVADQTFVEFTRERMFEPLGMERTGWRDDYQRLVPGRATAYTEDDDGTFRTNRPNENVYGNAALLTTVGDLLTWNENLQTGRVGGPEFVEAMHAQGRLDNGRQIAYASGLRVTTYKGVPTVTHGGATAGYRAYLARFPEQRVSIAVLCNVGSANPGSLGTSVADLFLPVESEARAQPESAAESDVAAAQLRAKAGLYRSDRTGQPMRLEFSDDSLRTGGGTALIPRSRTEFRVGDREGLLTFEDEGDGFKIVVSGRDAGDDEYLPVREFEPAPGELDLYVGSYYSRDAETELRVTVEGGALVMHRRPDTSWQLEPVYRDGFESDLGFIRFHSDRTGYIQELGVGQSRIHDIRFQRGRP